MSETEKARVASASFSRSLDRKSLVCVNSKPRIGPGFTNDPDPFPIDFNLAVELELDRLCKRRGASLFGDKHFWIIGRKSEGRYQGLGPGQSGKLPYRRSRAQRFKLPQARNRARFVRLLREAEAAVPGALFLLRLRRGGARPSRACAPGRHRDNKLRLLRPFRRVSLSAIRATIDGIASNT